MPFRFGELFCVSYPSRIIKSFGPKDSREFQAAANPPNPLEKGFNGPFGKSSCGQFIKKNYCKYYELTQYAKFIK